MLPTLNELKEQRSTERASELSPEVQINPGLLHGPRYPDWDVEREEPWHRMAAHLFATGCTSSKQVASILNVHRRTVQNLLKQKWFQEHVTKLLAENGGKDIIALLRAEQINSLVVMIELRDDPKNPPAVRHNICKDILDRTLGKPVQRIETSESPTSDDPVAEARRLREEIARSRERSGEQ